MQGRHIQDFSNATSLEPHWGYADRVVPCTNDAGSCEYLDVVYSAHDVGMIYSGIFWSTILGILFIWAIITRSQSTRSSRTISTILRKYFLPEFQLGRWIIGRVTRLQIIVLGLVASYLFIFSFAGMKYSIWITPVKNNPGVYNTRSTLGPWSDRVGLLAYALTPLSILLASRESLLSVITGLPYHHFNFLHRWLGHIIFIQSALHTIGWCIIEIKLYQPQPDVAVGWIKQTYMIWGVVAMIILCLLWGLSTKWAQRRFGYEFFKKAHYVLAMIYIGAAIGHWSNLQCFLIPSILLWGIDHFIRLIRMGLIHYRIMSDGKGIFSPLSGKLTYHPEGIVRIDIENNNNNNIQTTWEIGQHFFLTFPKLSIWQSHPFTPLSLPSDPIQSYILRSKKGQTKKLSAFENDTTPIILCGPYGTGFRESESRNSNVLCIAGGTGITFVLPILLQLSRSPKGSTGQVEFIWIVRHKENTEWIKNELQELRSSGRIRIAIFATRDLPQPHSSNESSPRDVEKGMAQTQTTSSTTSSSSSSEQEKTINPNPSTPTIPVLLPSTTESTESEKHVHPDLHAAVRDFVSSTEQGSTTVYTSGPAGIIRAVREEVARLNDPKRVWRGVESGQVELVYDERLD